MADDDPEVITWQKRLEKVEQGLAQLLKPSADVDDPPKAGSPPEPVTPPKSDATPPEKPKLDEPPPKVTRGPLHKLIFG